MTNDSFRLGPGRSLAFKRRQGAVDVPRPLRHGQNRDDRAMEHETQKTKANPRQAFDQILHFATLRLEARSLTFIGDKRD